MTKTNSQRAKEAFEDYLRAGKPRHLVRACMTQEGFTPDEIIAAELAVNGNKELTHRYMCRCVECSAVFYSPNKRAIVCGPCFDKVLDGIEKELALLEAPKEKPETPPEAPRKIDWLEHAWIACSYLVVGLVGVLCGFQLAWTFMP